jgi:hypothetical protein
MALVARTLRVRKGEPDKAGPTDACCTHLNNAQAVALNGERISKNSPRIITDGGIPNIW